MEGAWRWSWERPRDETTGSMAGVSHGLPVPTWILQYHSRHGVPCFMRSSVVTNIQVGYCTNNSDSSSTQHGSPWISPVIYDGPYSCLRVYENRVLRAPVGMYMVHPSQPNSQLYIIAVYCWPLCSSTEGHSDGCSTAEIRLSHHTQSTWQRTIQWRNSKCVFRCMNTWLVRCTSYVSVAFQTASICNIQYSECVIMIALGVALIPLCDHSRPRRLREGLPRFKIPQLQ